MQWLRDLTETLATPGGIVLVFIWLIYSNVLIDAITGVPSPAEWYDKMTDRLIAFMMGIVAKQALDK